MRYYVIYFFNVDNFTDAAVSGRINGEHKEKDLEPWDGGDTHNSDSLESLDTDVVRSITQTHQTRWYQLVINGVAFSQEWKRLSFVKKLRWRICLAFLLCLYNQSNGWDPNDMFKYNEEKYGVLSTYDSSLSTYT